MSDHVLTLFVWQQVARATLLQRVTRDEAGEGVISAAIAVLVMAFLGVLMWQLFKGTLSDANDNVNDQINQIGR
jgi:ABC-type polysaccharide/polyol phosphate export permease